MMYRETDLPNRTPPYDKPKMAGWAAVGWLAVVAILGVFLAVLLGA